MDFSGQSAVVTGEESGIGRACAVALGRAKARVALTYFSDKAAADAVVAEVEQAGGEAIAVRTDVGSEAAAEAEFGPVRLLVNAAGLNMSWNLSTGPIISRDGQPPVMFSNGATADARWRIGWIARTAPREPALGRRARPNGLCKITVP